MKLCTVLTSTGTTAVRCSFLLCSIVARAHRSPVLLPRPSMVFPIATRLSRLPFLRPTLPTMRSSPTSPAFVTAGLPRLSLSPTSTLVSSRASTFTVAASRTARLHCYAYVRRNAPRASAQSQQDIEWNQVTVTEISPACEDHFLLSVNVGVTFELGSLTDSYRVPGMFVQLRPTDAEARGIRPGFFAISSPPTITGIFEFLIKQTDSTAWLSELKPGDVIESSPVMGKGFPFSKLEEAPQDVLLFATGSGIAPIRAAIESILNGIEPKLRRSVKLFYGARTPQRMAYMDRFEAWHGMNVTVIPVISQPEKASEPWSGHTGYVQAALAETRIGDPANTVALLCGVKPMAEEVKAMLLEVGVPEHHILFNF